MAVTRAAIICAVIRRRITMLAILHMLRQVTVHDTAPVFVPLPKLELERVRPAQA